MKNMKKSDYYSFVQKKKMEDKPFMIHTNVKRIACWLVIPIFSSPFFFFSSKKKFIPSNWNSLRNQKMKKTNVHFDFDYFLL